MIANDDLLAGYATRFIVSRDDPNYFLTDSSLSLSAEAFMPDEVDGVLETSVFLHKTEDDIPWEEGARAFKALNSDGSLGKRPALAAVVPCSMIASRGLSIVPDNCNGQFSHHANIRSWNIGDASLRAAELAAKAQVHVNPARNDKFAKDARKALAYDASLKSKS